MKVPIINSRNSSFIVADSKRDQVKVKKNVKFSKHSTKEAMIISKAKLVRITGKPNSEEKRSAPFRDTIRRCPTLKEF